MIRSTFVLCPRCNKYHVLHDCLLVETEDVNRYHITCLICGYVLGTAWTVLTNLKITVVYKIFVVVRLKRTTILAD